MIAEEMKLVIRAETNNAIANMQKFSNATADARVTSTRLQDRLTGFGKSLLAAGGLIFGLHTLVNLLKSSIVEFQNQEAAEAKLATAIKSTGKETLISVTSIGRLANELQKTTMYADDATIAAAAMLQQLANLDERGLKEIIPRVQNFAAAMGVDLQTAASLVGKTLGSSTNALSRYGVEIDATADKSTKLGQLTKALDEKFSGMAVSLGKTTSGQLTIFKNQLSDLKEALGKEIVPLLTKVTGSITFLINEVNKSEALRKALSTKGLQEAISSFDSAIETISLLEGAITNLQETFPKLGKSTRDQIARIQERIDMIRQVLPLLETQRIAQEKEVAASQKAAAVYERRKAAAAGLVTQLWNLAANTASLENRNDAAIASFERFNPVMVEFNNNALRSAEALKYQEEVIRKAQEQLALYEEQAQVAVRAIEPFADAIGMMAVDAEKGWEMFKTAAQDAIAAVLEMLAKKAFVEAAAAFAAQNYVSGALWTAAGIAALVAAGVVKAMKEGGIVTRPTTALIGEAGPEAVIPLSKMGNMGGTRVVVHVYGSVMREEGLARRIGSVIARQQRGY